MFSFVLENTNFVMRFIMKTLISISLILLLFAGQFRPLVIVLDFYLHRDYIAANFCQNRDKSINTCHGKCYLKKQLKAASKQTNNEPAIIAPVLQDFIYQHEIEDFTANCPFYTTSNNFTFYKVLYSFKYYSSIFHPPKILVTSFS